MRVVLRMAARDMFPETINEGYRRAGIERDPQGKNADIWLRREVEWDAVPRRDDTFDLQMAVDPRTVESVEWRSDGVVEVWLSDFDTDEIGSEAEGVEALLIAGWPARSRRLKRLGRLGTVVYPPAACA